MILIDAGNVMLRFKERQIRADWHGGEPFTAHIKSEIAKWAKVIKDTGVRLDSLRSTIDAASTPPMLDHLQYAARTA